MPAAVTAAGISLLDLCVQPEIYRVQWYNSAPWAIAAKAIGRTQRWEKAVDANLSRTGEKADGLGFGGAHILVVEDDSAINDVVCRRLAREGFRVESAFSGTEAGRLLVAELYDLVITDLMLPGMAGEEVVSLARQVDSSLPVIVISARSTPADKVGLLGLGADDYLTKPFDLDEMVARVRVQLRHRARGGVRGEGAKVAAVAAGRGETADVAWRGQLVADGWTSSEPICQGAVAVSPSQRSATCNGTQLTLTRIEFDILELLASHPKRVFTKQELYELVWGEPFLGQENSVSVHVSNLRAKMKAVGADGYIQTVWGLGFKFEMPAQL